MKNEKKINVNALPRRGRQGVKVILERKRARKRNIQRGREKEEENKRARRSKKRKERKK